MRHAEAVVDEHLLVALRHAHRGDDGAGGIGAHQEVDLVDRDELLVERAGHLRLGLVVEQHPFHGTAEQAVALVQLLDVDLGGDLVQERGRGEGTRQRERAADLDRRAGRRGSRRHRQRHGENGAQHSREAWNRPRAHRRLLGGADVRAAGRCGAEAPPPMRAYGLWKAAPEPTRRSGESQDCADTRREPACGGSFRSGRRGKAAQKPAPDARQEVRASSSSRSRRISTGFSSTVRTPSSRR